MEDTNYRILRGETYNRLYAVNIMKCPYCANATLKVTDKRGSPVGIRRRRECLKCGKRFTTHEIVDSGDFYVVKKDNSRERFSREKLEKGVQKAFEKRPTPKEEIEKMINEVDEQLRKKGKKEIKSSVIGELVMKKIKKLDNVAYIRFASVYRNFQDVKAFREELRELK